MLDGDENDEAENIKDRYVIQDPLEDWILKFFEIAPTREDWLTPTTDIIETLHTAGWRISSGPKAESMAISSALKTLGAVKPKNKIMWNGTQVRGYTGIRWRQGIQNNQPQPTSY